MRPPRPFGPLTRRCWGLSFGIAVAFGAGAAPGGAGTVTGTATIKATLAGVCEFVSTRDLDFGGIDGTGALADALDATGRLTVSCTQGQPYTVYLGDGDHRASAGSGLRNMGNGAARLPYQLFKDVDRGTVWDANGIGEGVAGGVGGVDGTGSGASQDLIVYGRIAAGTTVSKTPGAYADTILVTVAY
ncbi:spore coat protein U domain-containing protein [Sphingomonas sp. AP4-R1]|uniref:Csu type fimbrial protein n=1 Tax=Sphingomonas sp. AP4-R1 TaxID=2735134 RepID=UPI001493AF6C|nr:spore coat U domain-containing protein [Sphingomonas sp. AP4-R1]QJU56991.1 spore coat protein U domain-containing protein [Sphingomonas sp. AP4-R1]